MVTRYVAGLAFAAGSMRAGLRFSVRELIQKVLLRAICLAIVVVHRVQILLIRIPAFRPMALVSVHRRQ